MPTPTLQSTVAQLILDRPARSRLFHKLGIDFCCGGKRTLEDAARQKQLDPQTLLTMLLAIDEAGDTEPAGADPSAMGLAELCDHIEQTHHAFLVSELPRLHGMLQKVVRGHGERYRGCGTCWRYSSRSRRICGSTWPRRSRCSSR